MAGPALRSSSNHTRTLKAINKGQPLWLDTNLQTIKCMLCLSDSRLISGLRCTPLHAAASTVRLPPVIAAMSIVSTRAPLKAGPASIPARARACWVLCNPRVVPERAPGGREPLPVKQLLAHSCTSLPAGSSRHGRWLHTTPGHRCIYASWRM